MKNLLKAFGLRILFLIAVVFMCIMLISSCSVHRKTATSVKAKTDSVSHTAIQAETAQRTAVNEQTDDETETHLFVFDTAKPLDSITHRPPILSEQVTIKRHRATRQATAELATKVASDQVTEVKKQTVAVQKSEVSTHPPWWIVIIGIIIVVILACYRFKG